MNIERMIGSKKIAERLADEIANDHPNSRHLFPDSSFMLFGPSDFCGSRAKPSREK